MSQEAPFSCSTNEDSRIHMLLVVSAETSGPEAASAAAVFKKFDDVASPFHIPNPRLMVKRVGIGVKLTD